MKKSTIIAVSFNGTDYIVNYSSGTVRVYAKDDVPKTVLAWLAAQAVEEPEEAEAEEPEEPEEPEATTEFVLVEAPAPVEEAEIQPPVASSPAPVAVVANEAEVARDGSSVAAFVAAFAAAIVATLSFVLAALKAAWNLAVEYAPIAWAWVCCYAPIAWGAVKEAARVTGRTARSLVATAHGMATKAWPYLLAYAWTVYGLAVNVAIPATVAFGRLVGRGLAALAGELASLAKAGLAQLVQLVQLVQGTKGHDIPMTDAPALIGTYSPTWESCEW